MQRCFEDAIDTALCVSRITESLDCAGALSRQACERYRRYADVVYSYFKLFYRLYMHGIYWYTCISCLNREAMEVIEALQRKLQEVRFVA